MNLFRQLVIKKFLAFCSRLGYRLLHIQELEDKADIFSQIYNLTYPSTIYSKNSKGTTAETLFLPNLKVEQ